MNAQTQPVNTRDRLLQTALDATTPVVTTGDFTDVGGTAVTGEPALRNGVWDDDASGRGDAGTANGATATYYFDLAASPLEYSFIGHVGDGNFHTAILIERGNEEQVKIAKDLAGRMNERALALGGTVTGEHGIGTGKMAYMQAEHGDGWQVMGAIKQALDPQNILNPGKVVRVN